MGYPSLFWGNYNQSAAARLIVGVCMYERISDHLKLLHWLPVEEQVLFKTALMNFQCLSNTAPPYFSSHVKLYESKRNLRSIHSRTIVAPSFKFGKYGGRSFTCAAPSVWNALPLSVRSETDQQQFKLKLKTHLFANAYA